MRKNSEWPTSEEKKSMAKGPGKEKFGYVAQEKIPTTVYLRKKRVVKISACPSTMTNGSSLSVQNLTKQIWPKE